MNLLGDSNTVHWSATKWLLYNGAQTYSSIPCFGWETDIGLFLDLSAILSVGILS